MNPCSVIGYRTGDKSTGVSVGELMVRKFPIPQRMWTTLMRVQTVRTGVRMEREFPEFPQNESLLCHSEQKMQIYDCIGCCV